MKPGTATAIILFSSPTHLSRLICFIIKSLSQNNIHHSHRTVNSQLFQPIASTSQYCSASQPQSSDSVVGKIINFITTQITCVYPLQLLGKDSYRILIPRSTGFLTSYNISNVKSNGTLWAHWSWHRYQVLYSKSKLTKVPILQIAIYVFGCRASRCSNQGASLFWESHWHQERGLSSQ